MKQKIKVRGRVTEARPVPVRRTSPKVTVIVPCYNHGKYLVESLESILNQTYYPHIELIIVNDGSTDDTDMIARAFHAKHPETRYISLPVNQGKWHCLNMAIAHATGDLITCQDADDVSLPQRVEFQVRVMQDTGCQHNLCGFVSCNSQEEIDSKKDTWFDGNLKVLGSEPIVKMVEEGLRHPNINHYNTGPVETAGTSAMFYRRSWQNGLRFNPPGLGLRVANSEDSDFNTRMTMLHKSTVILSENLYLYRRGTSTNNEAR